MTTIVETLAAIQQQLKVPKANKNSFGGYNYRSCEDIVEAVKALLPEGTTLTMSDVIVAVGERIYVKANARLANADGYIDVSGWAREAETKKGMDDAQVTGAASSYARKYALNGLFCIDDTKDADATNTHGRQEKPKPTPAPEPAEPETADFPIVSAAGEIIKLCSGPGEWLRVFDKGMSATKDFEAFVKNNYGVFSNVRRLANESDNPRSAARVAEIEKRINNGK